MSVGVGPRVLDLVLPGYVPDSRLSLNGRHRTHWSTIANLRGKAEWEMGVALNFRERLIGERVHVDVTFVYPTRRRRDPDGLAGLCKPLLDTMVRFGLMPDDDSEHVEFSVRAVVEKGVTETRVRIEEIA